MLLIFGYIRSYSAMKIYMELITLRTTVLGFFFGIFQSGKLGPTLY